jgi:hypothetical protein
MQEYQQKQNKLKITCIYQKWGVISGCKLNAPQNEKQKNITDHRI